MMMPMFAVFNFVGFVIGTALVLIVVIFPLARILSRAGWNPWLSLLFLVPLANLVMLWVLAFGPWRVKPADGQVAI